jgi:hypothetical protein
MRASRLAWTVVALGLALGGGVAAAEEGPIPAGARLRVTTATSPAVVGTLAGRDATTLTLATDDSDAPRRLDLSAITRLEVSRGRKSHWLAGLLVGGAAGAALGAYYCSGMNCNDGETAPAIAFFGAIGAASGALVGALIRTTRWETASPERLVVGVVPVRGRGLGLSVRLSL